MNFKWQNNYTGEVFKSLAKAMWTAVRDMIHYPQCRTIKTFNISRMRKGNGFQDNH